MAGSKIPRWEKTAQGKFKDALEHPDFQDELRQIRYHFEVRYADLAPLIRDLIVKYNLPRGCYVLIRDEICFKDEVGPRPVTPPIFLISEADDYVGPEPTITIDQFNSVKPKKRVSLELTGEIQKQDLLDFINTNWKLIESKLLLAEPNRPNAVKLKQVNKLHLRVLYLREEKGMSYRNISIETGLTEANINKILRRMRQHRNVDK